MSTISAMYRMTSADFQLVSNRSFSRLQNGQAIPFSNGSPYWSGSAVLIPSYHADAAEFEMEMMRLSRPGETFLIYDARFNGPRADPGGVILGDREPLIHTLGADNRSMRISGLPAAYVLNVGDYIGATYGANPVRYMLLRVATPAIASTSGLTPLFEVEPHIPHGVSVGASVQLVRPVCRAMVTEISYGSARSLFTAGASFSWQETRR